MTYLLCTVLGFAVGAFVMAVIVVCINIHQHKNRKRKKKKVTLDTYAKIITTVVISHGLTCITMSYILAWFGMDPVVDVSSTLVSEIVAPIVIYLFTNMVMNIFEKNKLSFSVPLNSTVIGKDGTIHTPAENNAEG